MALNQSDALFEQGTDTNGNFANSVSGQTNSFFMPSIFSNLHLLLTLCVMLLMLV